MRLVVGDVYLRIHAPALWSLVTIYKPNGSDYRKNSGHDPQTERGKAFQYRQHIAQAFLPFANSCEAKNFGRLPEGVNYLCWVNLWRGRLNCKYLRIQVGAAICNLRLNDRYGLKCFLNAAFVDSCI